MRWADEGYWVEALCRYYAKHDDGMLQITVDLNALEAVVYDSDGPAYRLLGAIIFPFGYLLNTRRCGRR